MIRRTHKITPEQDAKIAELASVEKMGIDKEEVVQLALEYGLATLEQMWLSAGKPKGMLAYAKGLMDLKEKSIRKAR